jgi:hypothetical protein
VRFADEARIWKYSNSGEIAAWWENKDHSVVPVWYCYSPDENVIVMVGDVDAYMHDHPGWYQVVCLSPSPLASFIRLCHWFFLAYVPHQLTCSPDRWCLVGSLHYIIVLCHLNEYPLFYFGRLQTRLYHCSFLLCLDIGLLSSLFGGYRSVLSD